MAKIARSAKTGKFVKSKVASSKKAAVVKRATSRVRTSTSGAMKAVRG